jgi:hypothetical protein
MKITISKDLSEYIERLQFEKMARENLCTFLIRQDLLNTESFQKYHQEYIELTAEYELAKNELENTYVKPMIQGDKTYTWELDFKTYEVTIHENK